MIISKTAGRPDRPATTSGMSSSGADSSGIIWAPPWRHMPLETRGFPPAQWLSAPFQPETARFSNYASWLLLAEIGYEITQNSTLSFYIQKIGGGKYGEFNNLLPYRQSFTLLLKYFF